MVQIIDEGDYVIIKASTSPTKGEAAPKGSLHAYVVDTQHDLPQDEWNITIIRPGTHRNVLCSVPHRQYKDLAVPGDPFSTLRNIMKRICRLTN